MKRSIVNQLNQLSEQQQGYVGALHFRYMNLCIKAEPGSLIPVQVMVDGESNHLEDVAYVGQKEEDEYSLFIFPKYDEDMKPISMAVARHHPEFKQEFEEEEVDPGDGSKHRIKYLRVIMPEVNDDRHDALKQATDMFYEKCKAEMQATQVRVSTTIATLGADEAPEVMDEIKKSMDGLNDMWNKQRELLHEDKLKEIEEAYAKWQAEQTSKKEKEQKAETDKAVTTSMRITPDDE